MDDTEPFEGVDTDEISETRYAPVSVSKFILLYVVTFGLYSIVWFYRNWRYVKVQKDSDIWPIARAVFSPIWYYPLLLELRHDEGKSLSGLLAVAWFIMLGSGRLPDPYWLLWFASFLPLLPAVMAVNDLNRSDSAPWPRAAGWRARNVPVMLVGAIIVFFAVATTVQLLPSTRVVTGDELPRRYVRYLEEIGLVDSTDSLLYFYSPGMFSIRSQGFVLTDEGVGAYWTDDVTGELEPAFVPFQDIVDVQVLWSESWFDDMVLRIWLDDSTGFEVVLPTEEGGDSAVVRALGFDILPEP